MNTARILVIDDEPQIRRVLRVSLASQGYFVADAKTGEDALLALREDRFDLVLLDMNMPGMGGLEACRQIRATSEVAILMLTVRSSESDKVFALDAGADDFVTKPFSIPELLARIRANLRRVPLSPVGGLQTLHFGNVEINFATHTVTVNGQRVRFTPKEFELLRYLATNIDVAIPHGRLLQAVWGPDYGDQVEYLHVFVNQIRKKIEPDPSHPRYLLTEPRLGYRFCLPESLGKT
ncbi:MAG: response regulator transcription factor [Bryobacterales bacterium]|nr:response regulator transcription factor [Bryobacterales bacterium]